MSSQYNTLVYRVPCKHRAEAGYLGQEVWFSDINGNKFSDHQWREAWCLSPLGHIGEECVFCGYKNEQSMGV